MAKIRRGQEGFQRSDIESHHGVIQDHFSAMLAEEAVMSRPEHWWRRADKEIVGFDLIGAKSGRREQALRKRGGWNPVLEVKDKAAWWGDCRAWVSWQEEWISNKGQRFEIRTAGLTVFWGPSQEKRQIIRAEWSEPPKHSGDAGQPHWHADFDEILSTVPDEETGQNSFGISVTACHLAMAGWQGIQVSGKPWQSSIGTDLSKLSHWANMTLTYIVMQLTECPRSKILPR